MKELRKKGLWGKRTPMVSTTYLALKFKEKFGVQKRRSRARIARTESEVQRRWNKAITWGKRPAPWWEGQEDGENGIHCYIDNKSFSAPLTEEQKKLQGQVRVTHHLRTAEEGGQTEYIVPRGGRNLPGLPSFSVTAAVAHDKIIFWRAVPPGGWPAQKAADMHFRTTFRTDRNFGRSSDRIFDNMVTKRADLTFCAPLTLYCRSPLLHARVHANITPSSC